MQLLVLLSLALLRWLKRVFLCAVRNLHVQCNPCSCWGMQLAGNRLHMPNDSNASWPAPVQLCVSRCRCACAFSCHVHVQAAVAQQRC